jgi:hypothetical protein
MIDPPSGPGEFILSEDEREWLPLVAEPEPTPEPPAPSAPESEESSDGPSRPDITDQGGSDERDA